MPNISIPMARHAKGACVAPANTATKPIPANKETGNGKNIDKALPKVAPIKKSGVTSPPLNPDERVMTVNNILPIKTDNGMEDKNEDWMLGIPRPRSDSLLKDKARRSKIRPPIAGRKGG